MPNLLESGCAKALLKCLVADVPWSLHFNDETGARDIPVAQAESMPANERSELLSSIYRRASGSFQYLYDSFSLTDEYVAGRHRELYAMRFLEFLNSPPFLAWARKVTGVDAISFADAQATRYRVGHFLTAHDDAIEGKNRVAAYILNLTPGWRADWGGLLNFIDADGHVAEGYLPRFNALNILRVPQLHSVSIVAPFAAGARFSITGWLRTA
jgi:Rps23 Pro-64 3,4-dihydroxylase Tpa1-like proline 4-hydroxylase